MSDLIDRQAAIDCVTVGAKSTTIRGRIAELPSAQPETPPYVAEIESEYKKLVSVPCMNKPLARALYEVWKKHVREDVSRNG